MKRLFCGLVAVICLVAGLSGCDAATHPESSTPDASVPETGTISGIPPAEETDAEGSNVVQAFVDTEENDSVQPDGMLESDQGAVPEDAVGVNNNKPADTEAPVSQDRAIDKQEIPPVQNVPIHTTTIKDNAPPSAPAEQAAEISQITALESGFSSASFSGDDGFEVFLSQGGASSDANVTQFLASKLLADVSVSGNTFGCSTLTVSSPDGHQLFGRNFDWQSCDALVVTSKPSQGYASISTVNLGFISQAGGGLGQMLTQNDVRVLAALYAPLDGMNEKGLAISVNMIQDAATISQNTDKPDLTTTTAVRLLLNKAASVDEALTLLQQYDLHASMGMMIHFALADTTGRGVVVEYINNEMVVTETQVVTNFYLSEGNKHGIGTQQSHERYDILMRALEDQSTMTMEDVRDALDSVSKDNFNEFESTEWSIVFDLSSGEAHYYHRENYENRYTFSIG